MLGFFSISSAPIAASAPLTAVSVGSVLGTGGVGTVTLITDQVLAQTGLVATTAVGTAAVNTGTGVLVIAGGSEATTAVGDITVTGGTGNVVTLEGVEADANFNQVEVITNVDVPQTGLEAVSSVGTVTQRTTAVIPVVNVPGMTSSVGSVTVNADANITVTGVGATTAVGQVLVWGQVVPDDDNVWTEIVIAA